MCAVIQHHLGSAGFTRLGKGSPLRAPRCIPSGCGPSQKGSPSFHTKDRLAWLGDHNEPALTARAHYKKRCKWTSSPEVDSCAT